MPMIRVLIVSILWTFLLASRRVCRGIVWALWESVGALVGSVLGLSGIVWVLWSVGSVGSCPDGLGSVSVWWALGLSGGLWWACL